MFESRNRLTKPMIAAALATVVLGGCSASKDGEPYPLPAPLSDVFTAEFNTTSGSIPYPTDLFFNGSTDGTLNPPATIPWRPASNREALSALDGWSTTAPITTRFSMAIDPASLNANSVRIVELYLSNTTKAPASGAELPPNVPSPVRRVLAPDVDYVVGVGDEVDGNGRTLKITPLKPLTPSSGTTNIGYLVLLTNGITSTEGQAAAPSEQYASYRDAPNDPLCGSFDPTDALNFGLCRLTKAHLQIAGGVGLDPANVVLSWTFSTQSIDDTLDILNAMNQAQAIAVVPTGMDTKVASGGLLQGKANVYVGSTVVPYYLTPAASPTDSASVLTKFWVAAGPSPVPGLDPTSRNLTRFNPVPEKKADQTIPLLVTVPNATAAGGACVKPAAGWPVAIVQHGITGNRTQALAVADSFADACVVVAAIDLPLHGLVPDQDGVDPDTTSPLFCSSTTPNPACLGAIERTFNVDLVNNATGATGSDGLIDSSGAHYINIPSPLTSRDNNRQAASDLNVLSKSIKNLDFDGVAGADIDPNRVHLVGLSLGAMTGIIAADHTAFSTASVSAPGGLITQLLLESPTFGPRIRAALGAQLVVDSYIYNLFLSDLQTAVDSGDPINHIAGAQADLPLHLMEITGDTVVPNSATDRLIVAGGLDKLTAVGPNPVAAGSGGYTLFTAGSHGTLFDPSASFDATAEMQAQVVKFVATVPAPGGPFVVISNVNVLDLD
jgi:dienelactone hydrolase